MQAELFWIDGPWPGRLAIAPRPRGGDWLGDELRSWRQAGVNVVVSMLTEEEQAELDLIAEGPLSRELGCEFVSFPIVDREVPDSHGEFSELLSELTEDLTAGKSVLVHCRQGLGRAGLTAIGLLMVANVDPAVAIEQVSKARGCPVPETAEQKHWLVEFAGSVVSVK